MSYARLVLGLTVAAPQFSACGGVTSSHYAAIDAEGGAGRGGGATGGGGANGGFTATGGSSAGAGGSLMGGTDGSAGAAGSGGAPIGAGPFASCVDQGPGRGHDCGAEGTLDCCASNVVPGGTFNRKALLDGQTSYGDFPATVSPFRLDVMEVTVGRFRAFVDSYPTSRPSVGVGADPNIPDSGWPKRWDDAMPATQKKLREFIFCGNLGIPEAQTWSNAPGAYERSPMSCMSMLLAAAFCYWDGGRLPTFAEWQFAALGGGEERTYPWGVEMPDATRAVLGPFFSTAGGFRVAGSLPGGAGKWGQRDMLGSRLEFLLDGAHTAASSESKGGWMILPLPCTDCLGVAVPNGIEPHPVMDVPYWGPVPTNGWSAIGDYILSDGKDDGPTSTDRGIRCARPANP